MRAKVTGIIAGFFILGAAGAVLSDVPRLELAVIYSGNTYGELKPCGCAREEDQGGIERRAAYLQAIRSQYENTLLVDTGDNFKEPTPQGRIKALYLLKSMALMGYDAMALGDKDLVYGAHFFDDFAALPWLAGNVAVKGAGFAPAYREKLVAGRWRVTMLAAAAAELFYSGEQAHIAADEPRSRVAKVLSALPPSAEPRLLVLLTHMKREKALEFLDVDGIDVVINGHIEKETDEIDMTPVYRGGKVFVQAGPRGQKMGELVVTLDAGGGRAFRQRMAPLDSSVPSDAGMGKLYAEYDAKIESMFFAMRRAKKNAPAGKVYAGAEVCAACHQAAHDIWKDSRHGHAYATLLKAHKAFDPECLACHTTGFNQAGGFANEVDTPELINVQCEMCHGPALAHVQAPAKGWGKPAREACAQCHVKNHSPRFDFAVYWPRIRHQ